MTTQCSKGETDSAWWGGYCNHGNVLFPTWHRAYILRFEDALRSVPGCEEVTLPFWDELLTMKDGSGTPIPSVLTASTFPLDGRDDNPLYSYKLQQTLTEKVVGTANRYTKPVGYQVKTCAIPRGIHRFQIRHFRVANVGNLRRRSDTRYLGW